MKERKTFSLEHPVVLFNLINDSHLNIYIATLNDRDKLVSVLMQVIVQTPISLADFIIVH